MAASFLRSISRNNGGSNGVCRSRGMSDLLMNILSISIVKFLAHLLGEGEVNILTVGGSQLCDTFLLLLNSILNLRNYDTLLSSQILTSDDNEVDWLVDTGLDWLREGNLDSRLNRGDNGDIVTSLLGNLLAVVVSIAVISISRCWLTDRHHLSVTLLLKGNLNSLGSGGLSLGLVRVGTDFIVNFLNTFSTDSTSDNIAVFTINHILTGEFNRVAYSLKSRGTDLSKFNNILN